MKRKGKSIMLVAIIVVGVVGVMLGGGMALTSGERREGKNLPIAEIDFGNLRDGVYIGEYTGGMKQWRANKVQVSISSGKVTDITILEHKENQTAEFLGKLYGNVIEAQSLEVDTVSGATITTKAYLKAIEDALLKAKE